MNLTGSLTSFLTSSITNSSEGAFAPDSSLYLNFAEDIYGVDYKISTFSSIIDFSRSTTGTYVDSDGIIQTAAIDEPRFDYSAGSRAFLYEDQATNICTYSEDIANVGWLKQTLGAGVAPVVTSNHAVSPDGTTTADRVVFDVSSGTTSGDRSLIVPPFSGTVADGTTRMKSVYMKSNTVSSYNVRIRINGAFEDVTVTNEWQRFNVSGSSGSDGTIHIGLYNSINSDTADILVWGEQIEATAYITSYIPTSGASVTRTQDKAVINNIDSSAWFNNTEGTLYADFTPNTGVSGAARVFELASSTNNYIQIKKAAGDSIVFRGLLSGSVQWNLVEGTWATSSKVAGGYKANDSAVSTNGDVVDTDITNTVPPGLNRLIIGANYAGTNNVYAGLIREIRVYDARLTNAELEELSS